MASRRSRATATGFGLFAAPVSPVNQVPTRQGAVEAELAAWIRDKRNINIMRALERGDDPVQPNGNGVPPAANLSEAVSAATAIAGLHKGAAETALAEKRAAEKKAERLAAAAGQQVERAKEETASQFQVIMQMQQQFAQTMLEVTTASLKSQIEERDRLREVEIKRIEDRIEALQQRHDMKIRQRDEQIAKLQQEKQQLQSRPSLDDLILGEIREGRTDGLVGHLLGVHRQYDPSSDPDVVYRRGIAEVKVEEAREAVEDRRLEKRLKEERHRAQLGIYKGLAELIGQGREILPQLVGKPRGLERNGVPPGFVDEEPGPHDGDPPASGAVPALDPDQPLAPGGMVYGAEY